MSQKHRADYILEYAQKELSLANFDNHPITSSTLEFLKDLCEMTQCQPKAMIHFTHVLQHLINMKPITPITTNDFEPQEVNVGNGTTVTRHVCTRWSSIYKADDSKYYDDQAVVFRVKNRPDLGSMCIYQGSLSSKKEITLPYVVDPQVVELTEEEAGIQTS
jgi:hypothetical protein